MYSVQLSFNVHIPHWHTLQLSVVTLLQVSDKIEGLMTHWAFKNWLWVGAGTKIWTQYLPAH